MLRISLIAMALVAVVSVVRAQDPNYVFRPGVLSGLIGDTKTVPLFFDHFGGGTTGFSISLCNTPSEFEPVGAASGAVFGGFPPDFFDSTLTPGSCQIALVTSGAGGAIPVGVGLEVATIDYTLVGSNGGTICACSTETPVVTVGTLAITPTVECGSVRVGPIDATGATVIFAGESTGGAVNSVQALRLALEANGVQVFVVDELSSALFFNPQSLWVLNGTFPENHVLTDADGQFLVDRINDNVPVYLESNDAWGFDPLTPFAGYDGVADLGIVDGDDSCMGMVGSTYLTADFGGLAASYRQDNTDGSDYTDQLVASTTDLAGSSAGVVWSDDGSGGSSAGYGTGVFYRTNGGGDVLVQSWEFGGYEGNQNDLVSRYLVALGLGNNAFGRGDVNADGSLDISDAQSLLSFFFVPGSPGFVCNDAADLNDDGALDVSDSVYMLTWLFVGGSPPPPPGCGVDPTPDGLDCLSWTPCLI